MKGEEQKQRKRERDRGVQRLIYSGISVCLRDVYHINVGQRERIIDIALSATLKYERLFAKTPHISLRRPS